MIDLLEHLRGYGEQLRSELHEAGPEAPGEPVVVGLDERVGLTASVDRAFDSAEAEPDVPRGDDLVVDYLQQRPDKGGASEERRGWSGVVIAVAATILVVVGVVVVADGNSGDVVTDPASAPTAASPAVSPSVADSLSSDEWSRVPHDETVFGGKGEQGMSSVTVGGPGFVAVGGERTSTCAFSTEGWCRALTDEGESNAVVWTSVDGLTWARVPHDEAVFSAANMSDVTAGGPGLVAVGSDVEAAVWTSVDGLAWARVPLDEAVFGEAEMISVTVGGPGLVAVGTADSGLGEGHEDAAVWTSVDGLTWARVPDDESIFGGPGAQRMMDVTAGGPGLVAVGYDGRGAWDNTLGQDAAVWTSTDGFTWSRVIHEEVVFGGDNPAMLGVTAGGPGLVAVGYSFPHGAPAAVWTSVDGLTWSRVTFDEVEMSGTMWSVTVGGPGLVAVGQGGAAAAVWTSVDGLTWSLVAARDRSDIDGSADGSRMVAVTGAVSGLVAIGYEDSQGNGQAAVWTSPNG